MSSVKVSTAPVFTPITVTIVIDSEQDLHSLKMLSKYAYSVSELISAKGHKGGTVFRLLRAIGAGLIKVGNQYNEEART